LCSVELVRENWVETVTYSSKKVMHLKKATNCSRTPWICLCFDWAQ